MKTNKKYIFACFLMTYLGAAHGVAENLLTPAEINEKTANKIEKLLNGLRGSVFCEAGSLFK